MVNWPMDLELENLTRILQASISPVALISGVGLLILSLTNRFSRVTDRLREMAGSDSHLAEERTREQIAIFRRRASLLRHSISFAVGSVLVCSILVLALFMVAVMKLQLHGLILWLFALSLVLLVGSLLLFLWDMHLSLRAVQEHLGESESRSK